MRTVGHRKEPPISFAASAELLLRGACFNDEMHRLPGGERTFVRKGVYRFFTHADANRHQQECVIAGIVSTVRDRN